MCVESPTHTLPWLLLLLFLLLQSKQAPAKTAVPAASEVVKRCAACILLLLLLLLHMGDPAFPMGVCTLLFVQFTRCSSLQHCPPPALAGSTQPTTVETLTPLRD